LVALQLRSLRKRTNTLFAAHRDGTMIADAEGVGHSAIAQPSPLWFGFWGRRSTAPGSSIFPRRTLVFASNRHSRRARANLPLDGVLRVGGRCFGWTPPPGKDANFSSGRISMTRRDIDKVARALVAEGKGILAADETIPTLTRRFDALGIASTEQSRRNYRE